MLAWLGFVMVRGGWVECEAEVAACLVCEVAH